MKNVINHVHEQQAEDKKEVAELWESDKKEDSLLHQHDKEVKEHQPTDAAMFSDPHTPTERRPKAVRQVQLIPACCPGWARVCRQKFGATHRKDTSNPLANATQGKDGLRRLFRRYGTCREDTIENVFLCNDLNGQQSGKAQFSKKKSNNNNSSKQANKQKTNKQQLQQNNKNKNSNDVATHSHLHIFSWSLRSSGLWPEA